MSRGTLTVLILLILISLGFNFHLASNLAARDADLTSRQAATLRYAAICLDSAADRLERALGASSPRDKEIWLERATELFHTYTYLLTLARRQVSPEVSEFLFRLEEAVRMALRDSSEGSDEHLDRTAGAMRAKSRLLTDLSELVETEGHSPGQDRFSAVLEEAVEPMRRSGIWEFLLLYQPDLSRD